MAIKVIVELTAHPGRRDELVRWLDDLVASQGADQPGFIGSTRYEVLGDPDALVEIADWESADARAAHMEQAAVSGAYAPLAEMLAAPFRVTVVSELA
ncbi:putative quinol monooxygenase [Agromyces binzhouensis]|uniref:Antibiotic biosynthesis monooxygenase n=1 Tax=Agromyces binzhouensis TaxID=1817495 RepID=A0A4Q2JJG4_9MICO|nr:antibiotic biosynthesis monooxygenase family protein [Agromyces binzhouensis]RXZ46038.1 antibiotic biosynthesis monooxygenase [Agromyces binzhouensis]